MIDLLDPIAFIEHNFTLNGEPFVLISDKLEEARHYLRGLYYTPVFSLPKSKKPMVIVKGRQVELTTTITNLVAYFLQNYDYFPILYAVPQLKQAKRFSSEKFGPLYRYRIHKDILPALDAGTWTIEIKKFQNGSTLLTESIAEMGDNIRGLSVEMVIKDEYQDLDPASEQVINECLTHAKYKIDISLGTPKDTDTNFENKWKASNQNHYHLCCPKCGEWFKLTLELMVKGFEVRCPKCSNVEDKRVLMPFGKWIPLGSPDAPFVGYHLNQLYVPYITLEDINTKIAEAAAQGGNVEKFIKNEILGEFYSGMRQRPSSISLDSGFKSELPYDIFVPLKVTTYAGVDWGGWSLIENDPEQSLSVYTDGFFDKNNRLVINYTEVLEDRDEVKKAERVIRLMRERRIGLLVADSGYGKTQNMMIQQEFPDRFMACKYIPGNSLTILNSQPEKNLIKVNRDYSLQDLYASLQAGTLVIPYNEHTAWMKEHFLNHDIVLVEQGQHVYKKFVKVKGFGKRVDAVHSVNFFRIAAFHDSKALENSTMPLQMPKRGSFLPSLIRSDGTTIQQRQNFRNSLPIGFRRGD